ncbi:MAG: Lsm family RNA-binding protein [Desulfurococcaceae archaeon]|jgi:small nuclear ribonucleoprotein (snRNP)-like protein|nr:Lsm family RNA-binding protein [Desulfurococcaceae archaeon]MCC6052724.1 Lsm family RNA-binding protein [Desulfurococcaceae archaeon]
MSTVDASRRLINELVTLLDRRIRVVLVNGKQYEGVLVGFDHPSLNILLKSVTDESGLKYSKIIVKGERISEIIAVEEPLFDPEEFKEFLLRELKLQEHAVKVIPEARSVEVLGRYRVSEEGVMGSGAMAETLYGVYKKYIELKKKGMQG